MPIYFCNGTRYLILLLTIAGLTLMMSNTLVFNFTNICMVSGMNRTDIFTKLETDIIMSGVAFGGLLGAVPVTYITNQYGTRMMFTGYGLTGAVFTFITPFFYSYGVWSMFVLRIIQCLPVASVFVSMATIVNEWAPVHSTGFFLSWMSCNIQFGAMFTMPIAGYLCESHYGWPSVYYLHGVLSVIMFAVFFLFFRDTPREQRNVSPAELAFIEAGKLQESPDAKEVPYYKMLSDGMVWIIMLAFFTGLFGINLFIQYGANYLNKGLRIDVADTGIAAALPFGLSCALKMIAGPASDRCVFLSEKTRIILFASISQFLMAACYVALAFMPKDWDFFFKVFYTLVVVFSGLNVVGVMKSVQEVARFYSRVIMAWVTVISSLIYLLLLFIINVLLPSYSDLQGWSRLFIFTAALVIFGNMIFIFCIDVRPRDWAVQTAAPATHTTHEAVTPYSPRGGVQER